VRQVEPLAEFNALPPGDAERGLLACCASRRWARQVAAGRPYPDLDALAAAADAALTTLTWADIAAALAAHPRIGERAESPAREADQPTDRAAAWSRREQSGIEGADAEVRTALVGANREYERRFDHVFLISASGRSPAEMLAAARQRVGNDEATERAVVRAELATITQLRLVRLVTP
jgi:2-oxo-4-hydroxy-4-carboxy-5-ureidoimidazoline decarboxylase